MATDTKNCRRQVEDFLLDCAYALDDDQLDAECEGLDIKMADLLLNPFVLVNALIGGGARQLLPCSWRVDPDHYTAC